MNVKFLFYYLRTFNEDYKLSNIFFHPLTLALMKFNLNRVR